MLGSTLEFELRRNLNEEDFELRIINALKNLGFQKMKYSGLQVGWDSEA